MTIGLKCVIIILVEKVGKYHRIREKQVVVFSLFYYYETTEQTKTNQVIPNYTFRPCYYGYSGRVCYIESTKGHNNPIKLHWNFG